MSIILKTIQNFYKETILNDVTFTGAGNIYVSVKPTVSSGWLVIYPNSPQKREIIYFSSTGTDTIGDYIVISSGGDRGLGGTTAQTHKALESIRMNYTSLHHEDIDAALALRSTSLNPVFTGNVTVPDPTNATDAANKQWVLSVVTGGTISFDQQLVMGLAGEDLTSGNVVYLKVSDGKWWKASAVAAASSENVKLGIAQSTVLANASIVVNVSGPDTKNTGLTANVAYYLSDTAGALSTTQGTYRAFLGWTTATNKIIFHPLLKDQTTGREKDALAGGGNYGTPSATNKFLTADYLNNQLIFGDGSDGDVTISSPTTLTRDMYYHNLVVTDVLTTDGYRIYVSGTLSGAGTIDYGTPNAGGGPGVGTGGASSGGGIFKTTAGGAGGSPGATPVATHALGAAGGSGGHGGNTSVNGQPGGNSTVSKGIAITYSRFNAFFGLDLVNGTFATYTGGGGGGGGGSAGGPGPGGGGAGGGVVWIAAKIWDGTFTIKAIGGAGGNGGNDPSHVDGGGGSGAGGVSVVIYGTKLWTGSYNLAAGARGTATNENYNDGTPSTTGSAGVSIEASIDTLPII